MFRPTINSTPLTSQTANTFFRNIGGDSFHNDVTFISTLRALVASRVNEGESVFVAFRNTSYSKSTIEDNPGSAVVNAMYNPREYRDGSIIIHSFEGNASDNLAFCPFCGSALRFQSQSDFREKTARYQGKYAVILQ